MKNLPVPVFLRPLDEKEASMKVLQKTEIRQKMMFEMKQLTLKRRNNLIFNLRSCWCGCHGDGT